MLPFAKLSNRALDATHTKTEIKTKKRFIGFEVLKNQGRFSHGSNKLAINTRWSI